LLEGGKARELEVRNRKLVRQGFEKGGSVKKKSLFKKTIRPKEKEKGGIGRLQGQGREGTKSWRRWGSSLEIGNQPQQQS